MKDHEHNCTKRQQAQLDKYLPGYTIGLVYEVMDKQTIDECFDVIKKNPMIIKHKDDDILILITNYDDFKEVYMERQLEKKSAD